MGPFAAALACSAALVVVGASPAHAADATPDPAASCPPDFPAGAPYSGHRSPRLSLTLRLSSDTVASGQPLRAALVIRPLDGPMGLVMSRPSGARWLTIVDSATGLEVPARPDFIETISMVHTEYLSDACPITLSLNVRAAFDLVPGRYVVRGTLRPILRRDPAFHLDIFPYIFSNDVVLTVTA